MKILKPLPLIIIVFILCLIYIVLNFAGCFAGCSELLIELMKLLYAIAISFIAAGSFYFFQTFIPISQTKKRYKKNCERYRKNILSIILHVSYEDMIHSEQYGSQNIDKNIEEGLQKLDGRLILNEKKIFKLEEELLESSVFESFFKSKAGEDQKMWDRFKNGIETNVDQVNSIIFELKTLRQSTEYLLIKVDIDDDDIYLYLTKIIEVINWLETIDFKKEEGTDLFEFLWEMFTGENFWVNLDKNNSFYNKLKRL